PPLPIILEASQAALLILLYPPPNSVLVYQQNLPYLPVAVALMHQNERMIPLAFMAIHFHVLIAPYGFLIIRLTQHRAPSASSVCSTTIPLALKLHILLERFYSSRSSSSKMVTLMPLGVAREYSCRGCL